MFSRVVMCGEGKQEPVPEMAFSNWMRRYRRALLTTIRAPHEGFEVFCGQATCLFALRYSY